MVRTTKLKKILAISNVSEDMEKLDLSYTAKDMPNSIAALGSSVAASYKFCQREF